MSDIDPDDVEVWFTNGEGVSEMFTPGQVKIDTVGLSLEFGEQITFIPHDVINRVRIGKNVAVVDVP